MTPEQILEHPPKILTPEQRQSYFDKGFLLVENLIGPEWIERLLAVTDEMVERSRSLTESDAVLRSRARPHGRQPPPAASYQPGGSAPGLLGVRLSVGLG